MFTKCFCIIHFLNTSSEQTWRKVLWCPFSDQLYHRLWTRQKGVPCVIHFLTAIHAQQMFTEYHLWASHSHSIPLFKALGWGRLTNCQRCLHTPSVYNILKMDHKLCSWPSESVLFLHMKYWFSQFKVINYLNYRQLRVMRTSGNHYSTVTKTLTLKKKFHM